MSASRRSRGREGEVLAADYLVRRGYTIRASNWRTRFGEIDLIAEQNGQIVFVEVRSRATPGRGTPHESVDGRKQRQLVSMAEQYLQQNAPNASARIDVIAITWLAGQPRIEHLVGAIDA